MLKEITKLNIVDDPFFGDVVLDIFTKEENALSCIYGKNGSGKTSISNIINNISNNASSSSFLRADNSFVTIQKDETIFVFNEDYIDKNIRTTADKNTMDAILLFGEAADIDEEIENNRKIIEEEQKFIIDRNIDRYSDSSSEKCISKAYETIRLSLQNNWAVRQQSIRKNKNKSPVSDTVINEVAEGVCKRKLIDVKNEFDSLYNSVKEINEHSDIVDDLSLSFCDISEEDLIYLLNKTYDKRIISELSEGLIEITNKKGLIDNLKTVLDGDEKFCPICLQPLTEEHKKHLNAALEEAFDGTIKKAIEVIESIKLNVIQIDLLVYSTVCKDNLLSKLNKLIDEYNQIINKYREHLENKKTNIYDSMMVSPLGLSLKKVEINNAVATLNSLVKKHNDIIQNYKKNIQKLESLNIELSVLEATPLINNYKALKNEKEAIEQLNKISQEKIESAKSNIRRLNQKKKDYDIAKNEINRELAIIFCSKNRLILKEGEDSSKYYVYSKGKKIKLNKLSTGERNIIALCYFFEQLKANCNVNNYFTNKMLLVIDDPISSFDYENKLSVFSYLSKMIGMVINGNENNKVIVMSHERNIVCAINNNLKGIKNKVTRKIDNKSMENFNPEKNSNYENLMKEVYEFACCNPNSENFESKGNEIRRLLEAYGTFNYKCGIDELFSNEKLINRIKDKDLRDYYKQSLNVLALHFASHSEQIMKQYPDISSFDMFSEEEQVQHARNVLSFLFLVDSLHIEKYFANNEVDMIKSWVKDVKNALCVETATLNNE